MAGNRGVTMTDVLMLPDEPRQIMNWILRQGEVNRAQVVAEFSDMDITSHLQVLVSDGFLQNPTDDTFKAVLAAPRRPKASSTLWQALDE